MYNKKREKSDLKRQVSFQNFVLIFFSLREYLSD